MSVLASSGDTEENLPERNGTSPALGPLGGRQVAANLIFLELAIWLP